MRSVHCLVVSLFVVAACTSSHGEGITETGNPPVIDLDKVSLVVTRGAAHVVGQPGAVTPGGAEIELTVVGTNQVARGTSRPDGSFDVELEAADGAVVELRAKSGERRSGSVYVTRAGAAVSGEQLSCMQRTNLASQAVGSVLGSADLSCETAADCRQVSDKTVCTDSCGPALVSKSAVAGVEAAVSAVDTDLCASFAADGCKVIALPCTPPPNGRLACVAGKCTIQERAATDCSSCFAHVLSWGRANAQLKNRISYCDGFTRRSGDQISCTGKVPHCGSGAATTLEDVSDALAHPDVQSAFASGEPIGGPVNPGGFGTTLELDDQSLYVQTCGADCPAGIRTLLDVLDRLASAVECTEVPTCPPNARFVENVCLQCGLAGGCLEYAAKCAVVCSDASACSGQPPGQGTCSQRGVCEASGCL